MTILSGMSQARLARFWKLNPNRTSPNEPAMTASWIDLSDLDHLDERD